jgi:hypothetical protein
MSLEDEIKKAARENDRVREWVSGIIRSPGFDLAADALEAAMIDLRLTGKCSRDEFVVAALFAAVGADMSDDVTPTRLARLLKVFLTIGELTATTRRSIAEEELAGGVKA